MTDPNAPAPPKAPSDTQPMSPETAAALDALKTAAAEQLQQTVEADKVAAAQASVSPEALNVPAATSLTGGPTDTPATPSPSPSTPQQSQAPAGEHVTTQAPPPPLTPGDFPASSPAPSPFPTMADPITSVSTPEAMQATPPPTPSSPPAPVDTTMPATPQAAAQGTPEGMQGGSGLAPSQAQPSPSSPPSAPLSSSPPGMVPAEAFTPTPEHKAVDPVEELAKANAALMQVADQLAMANREIADNRVTIARLGRDRDVLQQKVAKFEERANRDPVLHGEVPATPGLGASPSPGEANANVVYK